MSLSPAYHLRQNKSCERLLFVELLRRLEARLSVSLYEYVGLGGPYLEDFAVIHSFFGNRKMTSLEIKRHILSRQAVNQPFSGLQLTLQSTSRFVERLRPQRKPLIVWFDYEAQDIRGQISEWCDLLRVIPSMSILKVTIPCHPSRLSGATADERAAKLGEQFADYGPFAAGDVTRTGIGKTVYRILQRAIAESIPDTNRKVVRTLASYFYDDGTPILTSTMIVGPPAKVNDVVEGSALQEWPFADIGWRGAKTIAIPFLSLREKLIVDRLLPAASARRVVGKLKLRFDDTFKKSVAAMEDYVQLYRQVPQFVRVMI